MDVSVESALGSASAGGDQPGRIAGRTLEEWNSAYAKVESYFHALRVRNKVLLGRLVIHVLQRAMRRAPSELQRSATELAAEEMDRLVTEWFRQVLREPADGAEQMLTTRGRMALLLADMPGKWQDQFLRPGPWPEEFVQAMRDTYLRAGWRPASLISAPSPASPTSAACLMSKWSLSGSFSACSWLRFSC